MYRDSLKRKDTRYKITHNRVIGNEGGSSSSYITKDTGTSLVWRTPTAADLAKLPSGNYTSVADLPDGKLPLTLYWKSELTSNIEYLYGVFNEGGEYLAEYMNSDGSSIYPLADDWSLLGRQGVS